MIAGLAYLCRNYEIMHGKDMLREVMIEAPKRGLVDMTGRPGPFIDGFGLELNLSLAELMRECVKNSLELEESRAVWFEETLGRGYYGG